MSTPQKSQRGQSQSSLDTFQLSEKQPHTAHQYHTRISEKSKKLQTRSSQPFGGVSDKLILEYDEADLHEAWGLTKGELLQEIESLQPFSICHKIEVQEPLGFIQPQPQFKVQKETPGKLLKEDLVNEYLKLLSLKRRSEMGGRQSAKGKESKSISRKASQDSLSTYNNLGNEASLQTPKRGEGKCLRSEGPAAAVSLNASNLAKSRGTGIKNTRPQSQSKVNVPKRHESKRRRNSGQNSIDEEEDAIKDPRLKKSEKSKRVRKQNDQKTQHINQPSDHLQKKGRLLFPDFPAFDQIQEEEIEESVEQKDQAPSSSYTPTIQQQEEDVDVSSTYQHQERYHVTISKFEKIVENMSSPPKIVYEQQSSIVSLPLQKNTAESLEYQSVSMKMQDSFQEEQMIASYEQIQLGYINERDEQIVEGKPQESSMALTPKSQSVTQSLESSVNNQIYEEPEFQQVPKLEQMDVENDVQMINEEEQAIQPIEPNIQQAVNESVETFAPQIQNPIQKLLSRQGSAIQQSESNVPEILMDLNHDYVSKVANTFRTPVERLSGSSKNSIISQPLLNKKTSESHQFSLKSLHLIMQRNKAKAKLTKAQISHPLEPHPLVTQQFSHLHSHGEFQVRQNPRIFKSTRFQMKNKDYGKNWEASFSSLQH